MIITINEYKRIKNGELSMLQLRVQKVHDKLPIINVNKNIIYFTIVALIIVIAINSNQVDDIKDCFRFFNIKRMVSLLEHLQISI